MYRQPKKAGNVFNDQRRRIKLKKTENMAG